MKSSFNRVDGLIALLITAGLLATSCGVSRDAVSVTEEVAAEPSSALGVVLPDPLPDNNAAQWDAIVLQRYERANASQPLNVGLFIDLATQLCGGLATMPYAQSQLAGHEAAIGELRELSELECDSAVAEVSRLPTSAATWAAVVDERFVAKIGYLSSEAFAEAAQQVCQSDQTEALANRTRYTWSEAEQLSSIVTTGDCGLLTGTERFDVLTPAEEVAQLAMDAFADRRPSVATNWDAIVLAKYQELQELDVDIAIENLAIAAELLCVGYFSMQGVEAFLRDRGQTDLSVVIAAFEELRENDCDIHKRGRQTGLDRPTGALTWEQMLDVRYAKAVSFGDRPTFGEYAERVCLIGSTLLGDDPAVSKSVAEQLRDMEASGECALPRTSTDDGD